MLNDFDLSYKVGAAEFLPLVVRVDLARAQLVASWQFLTCASISRAVSSCAVSDACAADICVAQRNRGIVREYRHGPCGRRGNTERPDLTTASSLRNTIHNGRFAFNNIQH